MAGGTPIDKLEIEVQTTTPKAEKQLDSLGRTLARLGSITAKIKSPLDGLRQSFKGLTLPETTRKSLEQVGKSAEKAAEPLKAFSSSLDAVGLAKGLSRIDAELDKTDRRIETLRNTLDYLKMPVSGVSATGILGVDAEISETTDKLRELEQVRSLLQDQRAALWAGMEQQPSPVPDLEEPAGKWAAFADALRGILGPLGAVGAKMRELAQGAVSLAGQGIEKLGAAVKKTGAMLFSQFTRPITSAAGALSKWKASIGRIVFYRAIRAAIKTVTDGIREGTENLYYFSQLAGSQFSATMDRLAASSLYLKNSFGAMAAPLIQAVAPAIEFVIDKVVALVNVINGVFAALGGSATFTKAIKTGAKFGDDLAGSMGGAADAVKDMKRQLIGIDELTILQDPTSSSGGGGGGGSLGKDYGNMFETVPIPGGVSDFAQRIKDAISAGDWYGVGAILADKLNGIISAFDTRAWGNTLGTKITHGIQAAYGFMSNFSFSGLAAKVADLLNGAFENLDFSTLGRLVVRKMTVIPDLIIGFFSTLDFGLVARSLSNLLMGAFDEATAWLGSYNWSALGSTVWQKIKDAVTNIDFAGLASTLFTFLGSAVRSAAKFLSGFFGSIAGDIKTWWNNDIKGRTWTDTANNLLAAIGRGFVSIGEWTLKNIIDPFCNALLGADTWAGLKESGKNLIEGLWSGITETLSDVGDWLKEHLVDPVVNGVKSLFGIASPSTVFAEIGGWLIEGLYNGISGAWDSITGFFSDTLDDLGGLVSDGWEAIKSGTESAWGTVSGWLGDTWDSISGAASTAWDNISTGVGAAWDFITGDTSTNTGTISSTVSGAWESVKSSISSKLSAAHALASTTWNSLKATASTITGSISSTVGTAFDSIKSSITSALDGARSKASTAWESIKSAATTASNNISSALSSTWATITSSLSGSMSSIYSSVSGTFSSVVSSAWSWGSDICSNISNGIWSGINWVKNAASSVASWISAYLHFSEPDLGPLSDFHTYMPDMLKTMAAGIRDNAGLALAEVKSLSAQMADSLNVDFSNMSTMRLAYAGGPGDFAPQAYTVQQNVSYDAGDYDRDQSLHTELESLQEEIISVMYATATQIVNAVNENGDRPIRIDKRALAQVVTEEQNKFNKMFGKTLQNV